jgi:hypothetical protein
MRSLRVPFAVLLVAAAMTGTAFAQSVVSVRSGLVNYSEGAVFIDNKPVLHQMGKFPMLHDGSDLLTHDGRAELLLTPDVFLRVGQDSAVRMLSSSPADTRLELLSGSAIFDSGNAKPGAEVTLVAAGAEICVAKPARLRVDMNPPKLRVEKGEVEVRESGKSVKVGMDQMLGLNGTSVARRMVPGDDDDLDLWSQQRNRLIFLSLANNKNILDPGSPDYPGDTDLGAWLGYLPPAAVLPMTGPYITVSPGYYGGYPYGFPPYAAYPYGYYGFYSASIFGYPGGYAGPLGFGGYGGFGIRSTSVYRPLPVSRYGSIGAGGIGVGVGTGVYGGPRPIGGIRVGGSVPIGAGVGIGGGGVGRPVIGRPSVPAAPRGGGVHR